jgi:hypothetical protein
VTKAERKALRLSYWRAFWLGLLMRPVPSVSELSEKFWDDVRRFERLEGKVKHIKCEQCGAYPMICLNGQIWLCWECYCEEMKILRFERLEERKPE